MLHFFLQNCSISNFLLPLSSSNRNLPLYHHHIQQASLPHLTTARTMSAQVESTLPAYARSSTMTVESVPSYSAANTTTPFPSKLPCSLTLKNLDRKRDPILFVDNNAEDRVVFELVHLEHSRSNSFDESLYQNLVSNASEIFASPIKIIVSAESSTPFAVRKHVASSTYEIIELAQDGSFGKCTKISTKGLFKSKYHLERSAAGNGDLAEPSTGSSTPNRCKFRRCLPQRIPEGSQRIPRS